MKVLVISASLRSLLLATTHALVISCDALLTFGSNGLLDHTGPA